MLRLFRDLRSDFDVSFWKVGTVVASYKFKEKVANKQSYGVMQKTAFTDKVSKRLERHTQEKIHFS